MKKPIELDNFPEWGEIKSVTIHFDDNTSHYALLYQAITGLAKKRFAPTKEIIQEWKTLLLSESYTEESPRITVLQKRLLKFIADYQKENKQAPTYKEMMKHIKAKSIRSVTQVIKSLEKKGYVKKEWYKSRGIKIMKTI